MQTHSAGSDRSRAPFKTRAEITAIIRELGRAYDMGAISKEEYDAGMRNAFAAEDMAYRSGYVGPGAGIGAYRERPDREGEMNKMQDPAQNMFEPTDREKIRQQLRMPDPMAKNPVDRFGHGGAVRKYQEGVWFLLRVLLIMTWSRQIWFLQQCQMSLLPQSRKCLVVWGFLFPCLPAM